MKIEILKDMTIEGTTEDLSKALDKYIENFNSGKVSTKIGWIEPTYVGKFFGRSTYEDTFEIKSVYKEDDRYYFETDSEEVERRIKNEFYKAGKRVVYDRTKGEIEIISIDLVGTEESYRYNKYKRTHSVSMDWFGNKVKLDIFEIYKNYHADPYRYYEINFGDRIVYKGSNLDHILDKKKTNFLNFLYVPVRILKYRFDNDPSSYFIEDDTIYKFPTIKFIDYVKDESLKNNIIFDTKDKYNIKNKNNEDIALLVYNEFGTSDRYFIKYRISDGKVLDKDSYGYSTFFYTDVRLPINDYFEISSELNRLKELHINDVKSLYYLDTVNNRQIQAGNKIHDILLSSISPWSSHAVSDTLGEINTKYAFLNIYSKYTSFIEIVNNKEHKGAILADIYKPDSLVNIDLEETDTSYNGKEFIRLFITTEGKVYYKVDNYNKLSINAVKVKENESTKVYVTDENGVDISKHFTIVKRSYRDDIVLFLDLNNDLNDYYIMSGLFEKLAKHAEFINEALDEFNKFKYEYERRMKMLEMSEDELIEHFKLNDMEADEFRKVYPYISKIKFY